MTNRKQQALKTKQKILDTAERLIKEHGIDAVSVDEIVAECGIAKGTFYHHFKTKDEVLSYIMTIPFAVLKQGYDDTEGNPFLQRLKDYLHHWFDFADNLNIPLSKQFLRLMGSSSSDNLEALTPDSMTMNYTILYDCLSNAVINGELSDDTPIDIITKELAFSMHGAAMYHERTNGEVDLLKWSSDFSDLVFNSILQKYIPS